MAAPKKGDLSAAERELLQVIAAGKEYVLNMLDIELFKKTVTFQTFQLCSNYNFIDLFLNKKIKA